MTDKPHILMGMYMIHKGAYKCCVWDLCMLRVRFFFFHCSEHHTEVWSAEKSFSQDWSVLKSVWSVQRLSWTIIIRSVFSLQEQTLYILARIWLECDSLLEFSWKCSVHLHLFYFFFSFKNVALYYTSPFHSTPVFSHVIFIFCCWGSEELYCGV